MQRAPVARTPWTTWSTDSFQARDRFEAWRLALGESHAEWSLARPATSLYRARLERHDLAAAHVVHCQCEPVAGVRAATEMARSSDAWFGVVLVTEGTETIDGPTGQARLGPWRFALWDSERPLRFTVHEPLVKTSLLVPKRRFSRIVSDAHMHVGRVLDATEGAGALAAHQLLSLHRHAARLDDRVVDRALDATLELFGAAFGATWRERGTPRHARMSRLCSYVRARLGEPDLSPERIAAAHGIATRTLHAWFHAEGLSFSRWLLHERLERCRRDLSRRDGIHVTEIAFRWGFNDAAHFSRAFKRAYGKPPRAFRDAP